MRKIILMVLLLMMVYGVCSAEERYKWIESNDRCGYFFDTQTIRFGKDFTGKVDSSLIDVWIKFVYNDAGRDEYINSRKKSKLSTDGYNELSHGFEHYIFNNKTNKFRLLYTADYKENGVLLDSYSFPSNLATWEDVIPNSLGEDWLRDATEYTTYNWSKVFSRSR